MKLYEKILTFFSLLFILNSIDSLGLDKNLLICLLLVAAFDLFMNKRKGGGSGEKT